MKQTVRLMVAMFIVLLGVAGPPRPSSAQPVSPGAASQLYLPTMIKGTPLAAGTIIIDHRHTDISRIPAEWIAAAREFSVHYAHTSHGNQILRGMRWLETRSTAYSVNIQVSGTVVHPQEIGALNVYDGNNYPGDTYILPGMYWETAIGLSHTRSVVDTGWFNVSLWTWCGQMSYYTEAQVQAYLDALTQLQAQYPQVRFVFYTGHTDGSTPGSTLWRNNDRVRQYVQQNGGVLFDFADIESYDPDGVFYPTASDACEWCGDWCAAHPGHFACQSLPTGCEHTHGLQCTLKSQAFWQLLARLAGWGG